MRRSCKPAREATLLSGEPRHKSAAFVQIHCERVAAPQRRLESGLGSGAVLVIADERRAVLIFAEERQRDFDFSCFGSIHDRQNHVLPVRRAKTTISPISDGGKTMVSSHRDGMLLIMSQHGLTRMLDGLAA